MRTSTRNRLLLSGVAILVPFLLALGVFVAVRAVTPTLAGEDTPYVVRSSKILAADNSLVTELHGEVHRRPVKLDDIPQHVQNAIIAVEDRRFSSHNGFDARGLVRAAVSNLRSDSVVGGSTISQQLVKNIYFPHQPRTLWRKGVEALLTWGVELSSSKEDILETYLNTVYFGRGVYGIQTAASSYFDKDVSQLTISEAAYLAGLVHMPGHYDWQTADGPESELDKQRAAAQRRDTVLRVMVDTGVISDEQARAASARDLAVRPPKSLRWQHPYFVDAVLRQVGVLGGHLSERFEFLGETPSERARSIYGDGLIIETTLDPKAQRVAESAVRLNLPDVDRLSASLVAIEPGSGHVRAIVGGRGYYPSDCSLSDVPSDLCRNAKVNLALGELGGGSGRQAGSAFKAITLAAAIEDGVSLRQMLESSRYVYDGGTAGTWEVENYDGSTGGGLIDVVDATVRSVNAAYARLVVEGLGDGDGMVGAAKVAEVARRLGFDFPTADELREVCGDDYGTSDACTPAEAVPAITLGAKEIAPIELAAAFATFAADGVYTEPTTIERITDASGEVLYEAEPRRERAIDSSTARGVTHALELVMQEGTGRSALLEGRPAAGKTGTSQAWRDAWFGGYTPELAAAVWIGNPAPVQNGSAWAVESMTTSNGYPRRIVGGSYPAMTWKAFMEESLEGHAAEPFAPAPDELFEDAEDAYDDNDEEEEESEGVAVGGGGFVSAINGIEDEGYRVVRRRACPPGGGTDGIEVWKTERQGDTVIVWTSRAVC